MKLLVPMIFFGWILLLTSEPVSSFADQGTAPDVQKFLNSLVVIHPRTLLYEHPEKKGGLTLEDKQLGLLNPIGTARCKGGVNSTAPVLLFADAERKKVLHSIACSNINDWIASEADGSPGASLDRSVIVLDEKGSSIQVALNPGLGASEFTSKKRLEFPRFRNWRVIWSAWLDKDLLSPMQAPSSTQNSALKSNILGSYGLEEIRGADIEVKKDLKIGSETWFEVEVTFKALQLKTTAFFPLLGPDGKPQVRLAQDGAAH